MDPSSSSKKTPYRPPFRQELDKNKGIERRDQLNKELYRRNNTNTDPNQTMFEYLKSVHFDSSRPLTLDSQLMVKLEKAYYDYEDYFVKGKNNRLGETFNPHVRQQLRKLHKWNSTSWERFVREVVSYLRIRQDVNAAIFNYRQYKNTRDTVAVFLFNEDNTKVLLVAPANQRLSVGYT